MSYYTRNGEYYSVPPNKNLHLVNGNYSNQKTPYQDNNNYASTNGQKPPKTDYMPAPQTSNRSFESSLRTDQYGYTVNAQDRPPYMQNPRYQKDQNKYNYSDRDRLGYAQQDHVDRIRSQRRVEYREPQRAQPQYYRSRVDDDGCCVVM